MEDIIKIKKSFSGVIFDDPTHTYKIGSKLLISSTQVKSLFKKPFDSGFWAEFKAKEYGVNVSDIYNIWEEEKNTGIFRGNVVHDFNELFAANKIYSIPKYQTVKHIISLGGYDKVNKEFKTLKKFILNFYKDHPHLIHVFSELVIGDKKSGIGGMIDRLAWDQMLGGWVIYDWKSDKEFETSNKYKQTFKDPISHLDDCELYGYSIQLNIYKFIFELVTGIEIKGLKVVWFNVKNDNYKVIDIPDLQKEVKSCIEYMKLEKIKAEKDIKLVELF